MSRSCFNGMVTFTVRTLEKLAWLFETKAPLLKDLSQLTINERDLIFAKRDLALRV